MRQLLLVGVVAALWGCAASGGDPRLEALSLARDDIPCTVSADCCAVEDSCLSRVLLVSAADRDQAAELIASAPHDSCNLCITPLVQVDCREGRCIAVEIAPTADDGAWPTEFAQDHCGALEVPAGWMEVPAASGPRAGLRPATVLGCGD